MLEAHRRMLIRSAWVCGSAGLLVLTIQPVWWVVTLLRNHLSGGQLAAVVVLGVSLTVMWRMRGRRGTRRTSPSPSPPPPASENKQEERSWSTWAQVGVSALTALAAVAALVYTAQSVGATRDQLRISEQGQITDRYSRTVEQLGSPSIDVRLGAIFALGRLMRDSRPDQPTIVQVLSTYVRMHAPRETGGKAPSPVQPDAQAALTVLTRRDATADGGVLLDLSRTSLRGAVMTGGSFAGATFLGSDLTSADLSNTELSYGQFFGATLRYARLDGSRVATANFNRAKLESASFDKADISRSSFWLADLRGAYFAQAIAVGTDFQETTLSNTRFFEADLRRADFRRARSERTSLFPAADVQEARWDDANLRAFDLRSVTNLDADRLSCAATSPPAPLLPRGFTLRSAPAPACQQQ
ncbi:pentapeptide repeat-containing protein [Actinoplanes sp. URMC 104]|uniref:pentapeptide repeat-containing protein n=1 Tax=Actinoplanes sp. URMC 104 TaxID=3423409 RepID=UPI003F1A6269